MEHPKTEYTYRGRRKRKNKLGELRPTGGNIYRCPVCRRVRPPGNKSRYCFGIKTRRTNPKIALVFVDVAAFIREQLKRIDVEEVRVRRWNHLRPGEEPITVVAPVCLIKSNMRAYIYGNAKDPDAAHHELAVRFVRAVNRKALTLRKMADTPQLQEI